MQSIGQWARRGILFQENRDWRRYLDSFEERKARKEGITSPDKENPDIPDAHHAIDGR